MVTGSDSLRLYKGNVTLFHVSNDSDEDDDSDSAEGETQSNEGGDSDSNNGDAKPASDNAQVRVRCHHGDALVGAVLLRKRYAYVC